jgi:hypothetical protein
MKTLSIVPLLLAAACTTTASAQQSSGGYGQYYYPEPKAAPVGDSWAQGMATVIRSQGESNLRNSEAAINYEDARSANFDNRLQSVDTYFQMRAKNRAYRAAERGPRLSAEQLTRIAKTKAPKQLTPSQLDPFVGAIDWPIVLQGEAYTNDRKAVDTAFAGRAKNQGSATSTQYQTIQQALRQMEAALKDRIRDYPPNQYMQAKSFIKSLVVESGRS